jgi:hypothetical protein
VLASVSQGSATTFYIQTEAVGFFEALLTVFKFAFSHISENSNINLHRLQKLRYHLDFF